ncbi:hypothetical protein BX600DRAFT_434506 [Xylariales sp. PMI_506]|nr:hypothetical protein BX600DRAFT_434506 [Xylariales sp. PMI_506]
MSDCDKDHICTDYKQRKCNGDVRHRTAALGGKEGPREGVGRFEWEGTSRGNRIFAQETMLREIAKSAAWSLPTSALPTKSHFHLTSPRPPPSASSIAAAGWAGWAAGGAGAASLCASRLLREACWSCTCVLGLWCGNTRHSDATRSGSAVIPALEPKCHLAPFRRGRMLQSLATPIVGSAAHQLFSPSPFVPAISHEYVHALRPYVRTQLQVNSRVAKGDLVPDGTPEWSELEANVTVSSFSSVLGWMLVAPLRSKSETLTNPSFPNDHQVTCPGCDSWALLFPWSAASCYY